MSLTKLRNPTTDLWIDLLDGGAQIMKYLQVFNVDKTTSADIALAIMDNTITPIAAPASGSVTVTGEAGSRPYEYFVTAINANGETEPLEIGSILNGVFQLDDTNNYHTITWDAVSGATSYVVYVRKNHTLWKVKQVTSGTSIVNDGSWNLAYSPPWLNMTNITCLLDYENIAIGGLLQMVSDTEISADEKIVFATTNSLVNVYCRSVEL
jgi:hypothetical protein